MKQTLKQTKAQNRGQAKESSQSIKKDDSVMFDGYQMYHNYLRPHMGLEGKTPSEVAGIKVEGDNKWITLIQNASQRK